MEWVIAFTIIGLYSAQTFLVCAEFLKPTPTVPRGGFTRPSYWATTGRSRNPLTEGQIEALMQLAEERRASRGEKVDWKQEGF